MHLERKIADFIEEQRAVLSEFSVRDGDVSLKGAGGSPANVEPTPRSEKERKRALSSSF